MPRVPSFRKSMMPVLAGLTAALLTLALALGQTIIGQREARTRAMAEGDSLLALNEVLAAMLNAETGQRGFLLTGKSEYLKPYATAMQRRDAAMTRLHAMALKAPDRELDAHLSRLDRLTSSKFAEMERSITLARSGFKDQAMVLIQADFGKLQMDAIRGEVSALNFAGQVRRGEAFERAASLERRLLPLVGVLGLAILALVYAGFRAERRRSLAEADAEQAAALRDANERTELLARELNHRVKNLFAVILSIIALSGRKPVPGREVVNDIRDRVRALSLAHAASQGDYATEQVALGAVIAKTMEPYSDDQGLRVRVVGPEVQLPARMVTPIGLIVHELATNAVKYGALSAEAGTVNIAWTVDAGAPPELILTWCEAGGPQLSAEGLAGAGGFGTQMTKLAAQQLGGSLEREWPASGARVILRFPLP